MARYEITAPDGGRYEITAPDDADQAQVMAYAQQKFSPKATASQGSAPAEGFVEGLGYGAKRTAMLVKNALNDATTAVFDNPVGQSIDRAGQSIGLPSMSAVTTSNKRALEQNKAQAPKDLPGKAGNILGTIAAVAPTMLIPGANSWAGAGLIGAGTGAVLSEGGSTKQRLEDAGAGAAGGLIGRAAAPVLGSAVRGTRDSVKTLLGASTRENTMEKAAETLSKKASGLYEQAEAAGVRFKQPAIQRVSAEILGSVGRPNAILRPKTTGLMQELEDMQSAGDLSLTQLDEFRQMIGKEMKSAQPSDLRTLQIMKDKLDDFAYNASASDVSGDHANGVRLIKDARRAWNMKAKAQTLDDIYGTAELNASSQSNNQSLGAVINGFKALAKDQKKMRFFTPEEQKQIKLIVSGETGERVLRLIGRFSPTGPVSGGVSGAAIAGLGPVGLAVPIAGVAAKGAATRATQRNINTLENMLMQGESIAGTRLSSPSRLPANTPFQDALMRVLQGSGIALPNMN